MILVVGSTGQLGRRIARKLLNRGHPVRALVREQNAGSDLAALGAEVVLGDLTDPESLRRACSGTSAVVTTANSLARGGTDMVDSVDRLGNANLIDAAARSGVDQFVFISALGADRHHPMPFLRAKAESEERLHRSGLAWTVLRPNFYMEVLMMMTVGGPALAGQEVRLVGEGRRRHSLVSMADVAQYAVAVLEYRDAVGETLAIGGPEAVSWREVVTTFEHELGRDIAVRSVSPASEGDDVAIGLLAALESYDSPLPMDALAGRYGIVPTSLADFVHGVVRTAVGT